MQNQIQHAEEKREIVYLNTVLSAFKVNVVNMGIPPTTADGL